MNPPVDQKFAAWENSAATRRDTSPRCVRPKNWPAPMPHCRRSGNRGRPTAEIMPRTFVVNAASIEGIEHPPGPIQIFAPERALEQQGRPQIMTRPVEIGDMIDHRPLKLGASPVDNRKRGQRQRQHDKVGIDHLNRTACPTVRRTVLSSMGCTECTGVLSRTSASRWSRQSMNDLLVAAIDRIDVKISIDVHEDVLQ